MIIFENAQLGYGEKVILDIKGLHIPAGSLVPVIGKNGSGKSTLLRAIGGQLPTRGISAKGHIIYQPQKPYIFRTSCENNIAEAMTKPDRERANTLLQQVGLKGYGSKKALALSGGECARLALARTMAAQGDIYLIDEPFAAIDEGSIAHLVQVLAAHCASHGAILLMPVHNMSIAARLSSTVLLIHNGTAQMTHVDTAKGIYQNELLEDSGLC